MDNYLVLINKQNKYEEDESAIIISADSQCEKNAELEYHTLENFRKLKAEVLKAGFVIDVESGYRSVEHQQRVYDEYLALKGEKYVKEYVATPGYSEHHSGLALDFALKDGDKWLTDHDMKGQPVLELVENIAADYGFVIRYPEDKENITGYSYEPWHLRYVGSSNVARYMKEKNLCLEEYLDVKNDIEDVYQIFISYKRGSWYYLANDIYEYLVSKGYEVFFDIKSLEETSGKFEPHIIEAIKKAFDFVILLTDDAIVIEDDENWLFKELSTAVEYDKNIIPIFTDKGISQNFPPKVSVVTQLQGIKENREDVSSVLSLLGRRITARPRKGLKIVKPEKVKLLTEIPPLNENHIYRDEIITQIDEAFANGKKQILLSGVPGIGKQTVAIEYARKSKRFSNVYYAAFDESVQNTIANLCFENVDSSGKDAEQIYEMKLALLKKIPEDSLLIITNLGDSNSTAKELLKERAFKDLCSLNIKIIFTSQIVALSEKVAVIPVGRLTNEQLISLFRSYCMSVDDGDISRLIDFCNGHTMTMKLMAKTIDASYGTLSVDALLQHMKTNEENSDVEAVSVEKENEQEEATINQHLRSLYRIANYSKEERLVLGYMAFVAPNGIYIPSFMNACPVAGNKSIIQKFIGNNLLIRDSVNNVISIDRILSTIIRQDLQDLPDCESFAAFVKNLDKNWNNKDADENKYRLYDTALNMSLWCDDNSYADAELLDSVADICIAAGRDMEASKYLLKAIDVVDDDIPKDVARLIKLSRIYSEAGDCNRAIELCDRAIVILESNNLANDTLMGIVLNWKSFAYSELDLDESINISNKAIAILEQQDDVDYRELACAYHFLGFHYVENKQTEKAIECEKAALRILAEHSISDKWLWADCKNNLGYALDDAAKCIADYREALVYKLEAKEIREEIFPALHPDVARSCNNTAITYLHLERYKEALDLAEQGLEIRLTILDGTHNDVAISYWVIGRIYLAMGDTINAGHNLMEALNIQKKCYKDDNHYIRDTKASIAEYQKMVDQKNGIVLNEEYYEAMI